MIKTIKLNTVIISIALIFLLPVSSGICDDEKTVKVRTKENYIREADRFYSNVKAKVFFDEVLQVTDKKNEWFHVRYKGTDGWIHQSAVVSEGKEKEMKYRPVMLDSDIDPSEKDEKDEVALAGKGFTPEVEKKMGENYPELNYALVDEIVNRGVTPEKVSKFIKEGGLKFPE